MGAICTYPESWQKECEKEHGKKVKHKPMKLNAGAGRQLDFLRVLVALHEAGYFTDEVGGQIGRKKDVFAALGVVFVHQNANTPRDRLRTHSMKHYQYSITR